MEPSEFLKRLIAYLMSKNFNSAEELLGEIEKFIYVDKDTPLEEFCGITPYKMMRILYFPFESPDVVSFNSDIPPPIDAPFIRLFILLINGINEAGGLKATAKGNLPRDFCREIEMKYRSEEELKFIGRDRWPLLREHEFLELHKVRVLAWMAGYIKNYKKRFVLTGKGKRLIKDGFTMDDYISLFKTFVWEYNWAYYDFYDEVVFIQISFLFTLYLLHTFGDEYRPKDFYADKFLTAFPKVLEDAPEEPLWCSTPEERIKEIYIHRAIDRFAIPWGFAEIEEKWKEFVSLRGAPVRKTDFLDQFVKFKI